MKTLQEMIYKIRMYLIWLLMPKSKLKTPFADAEKAYKGAKDCWSSEKMGIYFAVSSVIAYRFPDLDNIFNQALEYSKKNSPEDPKITDFQKFRDAAEWFFWWVRKNER